MILYLAIGLVTGLIIGWLIMRIQSTKEKSKLEQQISSLEKETLLLRENIQQNQQDKLLMQQEINQERQITKELNGQLSASRVEQSNLLEKLANQKREIEEMQKKLSQEFEIIANRILRQNSQEFNQLNQKSIGEILNPLKEKIILFESKVQETYEKNLKDSVDLRAELRNLMELNQKISQEANHLTKALKSDSKKMGNWGELILDRILEQSGLVKGKEYETQASLKNEEGVTIRPDVIVRLPENKHLIIDSKVSLIAFERFVNEEDEQLVENYAKAHIESVYNHIKGLSEKGYHTSPELDVPDFVLLFMPVEAAFSLAIQRDPELFNYGWERKIVIVSPTTLLATLKTVAAIWKHEKQTRNALEIAKLGGSLYDKFQSFLADLEKIGAQIDTMKKTYDEAHKKLKSGHGNLIKKTEDLKKLGVKTEKSLSSKYQADEDVEEES